MNPDSLSRQQLTTQMKRHKPVKIVAWDLDNTLWDGTLSEKDTVSLREGIPGILNELDRRGILSTVVSKNDHQAALTKLIEFGIADFFVIPQINWNAKSHSLSTIAERLNLSLDTFLFIDDQPFEREEVEFAFPEVRTLDGADVSQMLDRCDLNPETISAEARQRRRMYQDEAVRQSFESEFSGTPEAFLKSLNLKLSIRHATVKDLQRADELTNRTSQLNTTGYTYSLDELESFISSPAHQLLVASLEDKFGSYGIVGLSLIHQEDKKRTILLFLMSCRVMSRGIGEPFLQRLINASLQAGDTLWAELVRTERNLPMQITYAFAGFVPVEQNGNHQLLQWQGEITSDEPTHLLVYCDD
ncbi:MAG: FkbH: FkbH domain protein [Pantoea stewartii]|uniref:HAD-IIIC family phosphatase n=1 Tax=Pantoea stewartii TaxID=66269 RepID=UPI0024BD7CD5|nr:HAD-IIIC family phosphatase [Pantoea stewartii]WHS97201.1 MAG: FkbH: FkbH domain protein [Pantoea stewartii]WHT01058.1 MAG: FkbH: FkbH domain protein [Pantoea stewartii]